MARKRASMREGPLAELFRATEAAQRQQGDDEPADEPLPPAAEADDQQTLITEPPASAPTPVPAKQTRRHEAALEETVEHVYDFDPADATAEAATVVEAPVERRRPIRRRRSHRRLRSPSRSPIRRTSRLRAGSSSPCPRAPRG